MTHTYAANVSAFQAMPREEREALIAEFPPIDMLYAKSHGIECLALRYNTLRRNFNATDTAELAKLRQLKASAVEACV